MINNLLIIDNDEVTLRLLELTVARFQFAERVTVFASANAALEYFERLATDTEVEAAPELILLDIYMPVMDGWEFLEEYSARFSHLFPATKICMFTSSVNPQDQKKASRHSSVIAFISKPLSGEEMDKLRNHVDLRHLFEDTTD